MTSIADAVKRLRGDGLVRTTSERHLREFKRLKASAAEQAGQLARVEAQLVRVEKQLERLLERVPVEPRTSIDRDVWASRAQEGEFTFHKYNTGFRGDDDVWNTAVDTDWRAAGFEPGDWAGKTILDVGAGSRLRSLWFKGADVVVLEPLADRVRAEVPWNDFDQAKAVYNAPGEEFIPELENSADLIVSINALDHGFDIAESVRNIRRYLKPDGLAFLSFDMHDEPDYMHPLVLSNEIMLAIYADAGLDVEKVEPARRYHGADGKAFHYWLRHPAESAV